MSLWFCTLAPPTGCARSPYPVDLVQQSFHEVHGRRPLTARPVDLSLLDQPPPGMIRFQPAWPLQALEGGQSFFCNLLVIRYVSENKEENLLVEKMSQFKMIVYFCCCMPHLFYFDNPLPLPSWESCTDESHIFMFGPVFPLTS